MGVVVLKNFPPLKDLPITTKAVMQEVGLLVRDRVYQRTVSGTDRHGQPFRSYSPGYATQKQQAVGRTDVTLQLSGAMLNALRIVAVTDHSVEIGY